MAVAVPADLGSLLRSPALAYFIRNTVTIHTVLTHRIDHLRPSVQLTLKVATVMGMRVSPDAVLCPDIEWALKSGQAVGGNSHAWGAAELPDCDVTRTASSWMLLAGYALLCPKCGLWTFA